MQLLRKRIRGFFALQAVVLLMSFGATLITRLREDQGSLLGRFAWVGAYYALALIFCKAWMSTRKASPYRNRWAVGASCVSFGGGLYFFWVGHSSLTLVCRGLIEIIIGAAGFLIFMGKGRQPREPEQPLERPDLGVAESATR